MADIIVSDPTVLTDGVPLKRRFHDNGDGTWSEQVYTSGGGGGGGGAVTIADGADVTQGAVADAVVAAGAAGTLSAKTRRLTTDLAALLAKTVTPNTELSGLTAGALNADLVPSTDVSAYRSFSLQMLGTFSGTLTFQCSNDGTTWDALAMIPSNSIGGNLQTSTSQPSNKTFYANIVTKYIRVRMTSYTSGTATGVAELNGHSVPYQSFGVSAGQNGAFNVNNTAESTLLSSAARTSSTNSTDQVNNISKSICLFLNVTAQPGGGETLSLKIQGKDPVSGSYIDIADAGVLFTAATGLKMLVVTPGVLAADFVAGAVGKSALVPRTWRAVVTHSAAGSWTYSVGQALMF